MNTRQNLPMSRVEFVAFGAMMMATVAFAIDALLPALPEIAGELTPDLPNRAQLVLTSFMIGMGFGTFFSGPLSDRFGRKAVITAGAVLYSVSAFVAWYSSSLEVILVARALQGVGAAGPRIVIVAIVRDLYSGREMARMMSYLMLIFTLVPAVAPLIGSFIISLFDWRGIFIAFMCFSAFTVVWMHLRLPETLAPEKRQKFTPSALFTASKELFSYKTVRISTLCQTLNYIVLVSVLTSLQPIYEVTFDRADSFPYWVALVALISGLASLLNAALVVRYGMRNLILVSFSTQIVFSAIMFAITFISPPEPWYFTAFFLFQTSVFFMTGLTIGNLNALALQPVGHIAGLAASILGGVSTIVGTALAIPVGLMFDGSPAPTAFASMIACALASVLIYQLSSNEADDL